VRKLKVINHMSLDGVIQNSPEDGFPYADWGAPYRSPEGRDLLLQTYGERYDALLGRRTYDLWSQFWPHAPAGDPFGDRLRAATKYVVTHRPESLSWGPSEAVGPDLAEGVRRIKASDGPDLVCCGSSTLTSALLEHGLVDELVLPVNPVVVGTGKRLFAEGTPGRALELLGSTALASGIVVSSYRLGEPLPRT
jgi:dihydrofolate reductase